MGLKKGPWTPEEDQILISYVQQHGHGNWRALPKKAGLLRCGKSCRLRWTNYLRPDVKRGNLSKEEEETIIKFHEMLGNRWSVIASRLPGRTDNEIKNVWNTHLKKRLKNHQTKVPKSDSNSPIQSGPCIELSSSATDTSTTTTTTTTTITNNMVIKHEEMDSLEYFPEIDNRFWSEELSTDNSNMESKFPGDTDELQSQIISSPANTSTDYIYEDSDMEFWHNLFIRAGELLQLPEI
ncbi:unnamed protein product [Ilex paraguariensis]